MYLVDSLSYDSQSISDNLTFPVLIASFTFLGNVLVKAPCVSSRNHPTRSFILLLDVGQVGFVKV